MADGAAHLSALTACCLHCGQPVASATGPARFCCAGCAVAHDLIVGLGLERYYERRRLDPAATRSLRPEPEAITADPSAFAQPGADGESTLHLMVDGLQCAACVWLIESVLSRQPGVTEARLSMTTRRLVLKWSTAAADPKDLLATVAALGYRLVPYNAQALGEADETREKALLRAMSVAGFAAGNVMLLSVSIWAGNDEGMGAATRDLLHWISALIALPAIAYAGRPFFIPALTALRSGRTNMDVPISVALILAPATSLVQTLASAEHAYFDSAVTLLFFLLIGRYLDCRARGRARSAATELLALRGSAVTILGADGQPRVVPPSDLQPGMIVMVAAGGRIGVDGRVVEGVSDVDTGLITGESVPASVQPGDRVFAGTMNLAAPLRLEVTGVGEATLLAEIARLMEAAEHGRGRFVVLADRVARRYAPVVHVMAATTFIGWTVLVGASWQVAMQNAIAVLIITCPCALALAVPVVQVAASGRLLRRGILLKSATALERLCAIDTVVLDKTGTLTLGRPMLVGAASLDPEALRGAASLAAASTHPLAQALHAAAPDVPVASDVRERPGAGLSAPGAEGETRLGSAQWCGVVANSDSAEPELWYRAPGRAPVRFAFEDRLREDATTVVAALCKHGYRVELLSGDRPKPVEAAARGNGSVPAFRCPTWL